MSLESKIDTIEAKICSSEQMFPRNNGFSRPQQRPENASRPSLDLQLPPRQQTPKKQETEKKLREIMEQSGKIKINGIEYRTGKSDLEDLGELGNGTSGHVVKMRHIPSGEIIAVKQMRRTGNDDENKRITTDLDVVLKSHGCPYIVQCLGFIITSVDVYICMELMATCFDKLLKRTDHQPIPEDILGKVTVATVNALAYLKDKHCVIHRDVKPSNILIDERGVIKLCDFGISGRLNNSKAKTRSAGCAAYMAPERIDPRKQDYDIRADVWSLGITLVELATGKFPYQGCQTDFEVLTKVLQSDPPSLPTDQGFSLEFQSFVQRCLNKDYHSRPKYPELLQQPFLVRYKTQPVDVVHWFSIVMIKAGLEANIHHRISPPHLPTEVHRNTVASEAIAPSTIVTAVASGAVASSSSIPNYQFSPKLTLPPPLSPLPSQIQLQQPVRHKIHHHHHQSQPTSPPSANGRSEMAISLQQPPLPMYPYEHYQFQQHHHHQQQQAPPPQHQQQLRRPSPSVFQTDSAERGIGYKPTVAAVQQEDIVSEMNKMYKRSPFMQRKKDVIEAGTSPRRESKLSNFGNSLLRNLTTSPFAQKKFSAPNESPILYPKQRQNYLAKDRDHWNGGNYKPPDGATAGNYYPHSPIPLRKAQPGNTFLENSQTLNHPLPGNTSPIVLQRFYHQQNQHREKMEDEMHSQLQHMQHQQQPLYHERENTNPFIGGNPISHIPKYQTVYRPQQSCGAVSGYPVTGSPVPVPNGKYNEVGLPPQFSPRLPGMDRNGSEHLVYGSSPLRHPQSNIPTSAMYSNSPKHTFLNRSPVPMHQMEPSLGEEELNLNGNRLIYSGYNRQYSKSPLPEQLDNLKNGQRTGMSDKDLIAETSNGKDDPGVVKRRFASYMKMHLAGNDRISDVKENYDKDGGGGGGKTKWTGNKSGMKFASTNPFIGDAFQQDEGDGYGRQKSMIQPPKAHMLSGIDRRHRSPDPPPRYNRGQSPLLLRKNLLELGQVGSPILPRRYLSASPPLPPPRRVSESVPSSPQHFRTRIHYTPEPQRRRPVE